MGFLRHMISKDEIYIDPKKIEVVVNWPTPTNVSEIRNFLRLTGYYRRFIEGFSSITGPLTKLTLKNAKFDWNDACEHSFQELKGHLVSEPVLTLPSNTEGKYVIYSDTSRNGLGCALAQDEKVIAYVAAQSPHQ